MRRKKPMHPAGVAGCPLAAVCGMMSSPSDSLMPICVVFVAEPSRCPSNRKTISVSESSISRTSSCHPSLLIPLSGLSCDSCGLEWIPDLPEGELKSSSSVNKSEKTSKPTTVSGIFDGKEKKPLPVTCITLYHFVVGDKIGYTASRLERSRWAN